MRNLESSPYLEKPSLIEIKAVTDRGARVSEFNLSVSLARSKEEAGKKGSLSTDEDLEAFFKTLG